MIELKKCAKDGCNPVEQTRGQMKPEDHHMQFNRYKAVKAFHDEIETHGVLMKVGDFKKDAYDVEDLGPANNHDVRISCSKCGISTGWDRRDTERFELRAPAEWVRVCVERDANMNNVRQRWNDMVR